MNAILSIKAKYFGIEVDLLCQLDHCSLVCFKGRPYVVETADLVLEKAFKETARAVRKSKAAWRRATCLHIVTLYGAHLHD